MISVLEESVHTTYEGVPKRNQNYYLKAIYLFFLHHQCCQF